MEIKSGFALKRVKDFAKKLNIDYYDNIYLNLHIGVDELFKYILELNPSYPNLQKKGINFPNFKNIDIEIIDFENKEKKMNLMKNQIDQYIKETDNYIKIVNRLKEEISYEDKLINENKKIYHNKYSNFIDAKANLIIIKEKYEKLKKKYDEEINNLSINKEYEELEKEKNKYNDIYLDYNNKLFEAEKQLNKLMEDNNNIYQQKKIVIQEIEKAKKDLIKYENEVEKIKDKVIPLQKEFKNQKK